MTTTDELLGAAVGLGAVAITANMAGKAVKGLKISKPKRRKRK